VIPTLTLNNGVEKPALGFGRWRRCSATARFFTQRDVQLAAIDGLDTGRRGGPEPGDITLATFGRPIPED
jgi:hypothetical protein